MSGRVPNVSIGNNGGTKGGGGEEEIDKELLLNCFLFARNRFEMWL
jgi:hypothetical protein